MELTPEKIKAFRLSIGKTQEQFGQLVGVTCGTINRWEAGECRMSPLAKKTLIELMEKAKYEQR